MKYALVRVLPEAPPGGGCAGIGWAPADHAVCVVDLAGRVRDRFTAVHGRAGIAGLIARLRGSGAAEVAIERGGGALVDALPAAALTVVVTGSRQVKNLRSRYGSSGAKDDRFDAFVLADTLRTDRARLRPLVPDSPAAVALRAAVRARKDLIAHRVSARHQLRAHLAVAFPGAIGLFSELDSPLSLAFLAAFPGQQAATVYAAARDRGKDHPHAIRITARAWVLIIWRCWQDGTGYDPAKHRALQDILTRQAAAGTPQPHR
ncbi:MAG TPA: transposase [Streptosporangiaceae bacterium]